MLTMKIEYIFVRLLYFMSYKSFEQKTVFWFNKEEASFQKWRKNILKRLDMWEAYVVLIECYSQMLF